MRKKEKERNLVSREEFLNAFHFLKGGIEANFTNMSYLRANQRNIIVNQDFMRGSAM